jgi:protein subunit release factor B
MARSVASSRQRQVQEKRSQIDRRAQEEQALQGVLIALMDEEERDLEELEAVDKDRLTVGGKVSTPIQPPIRAGSQWRN